MRGFATRGEANTPNEVSAEFPIGNWNWYWQHFHNGNILHVFELECRVGVGEWNWKFENLMRKFLLRSTKSFQTCCFSYYLGNNQDKRSARGADPTAARWVIAPYQPTQTPKPYHAGAMGAKVQSQAVGAGRRPYRDAIGLTTSDYRLTTSD